MAQETNGDTQALHAVLDRVAKLHDRLDKALARGQASALPELQALVAQACSELDSIGSKATSTSAKTLRPRKAA